MTLHDSPPTGAGDAPGGNGHGPHDDGFESVPLRPAASRRTSIRLAMIVPGLGLLILAIFITAEALSPPTNEQATVPPRTLVAGGLHGVAGATDLRSITVNGEPPANIVSAVSVPQGAVVVSHINNTAAVGQYDAQVTLRVDASQGALHTYFATVMKKQGWQIFSQGPASHDPGGIEVLGKQAGDDGFFWEMGATVQPTVFPNGGPPAGTTDFTVRLFQVPDIS